MPFDNAYALVIGIGSYQHDPKLSVQLPARDAWQVAEVLRNPYVAGYPPGQVDVLRDSQATRDAILQKLTDLAKNIKESDTLLIFYSGHGMLGTDKNYYLTTYDTQLQKKRVMPGSGVLDSEFMQKIRDIKAKRVFLIFNACQSGVIPPSLGDDEEREPDALGGQPLPDQTALALLGTGEGRVIITACRASQKSYFDPPAQTTLFAQALIDGLQGQGVSSIRGYISIFELYEYVFSTVSKEAQSRWNRRQEPELTIHKGIGAMAVALYRGANAAGTLGLEDRPSVLAGAIKEVDPEESRLMFQHIVNSVIAGRDVNIGDQYDFDLRHSSGSVIQPKGPVTLYFAPRTVTTGSSDYAGGNIDKRQGNFIGGGTFQAPVVGYNESGSVVMGNEQPTHADTTYSLQDIYNHVRGAVERARAQKNFGLVIDLQHIELDLKTVLEMEENSEEEQRRYPLTRALEDLQKLSQKHTVLSPLAQQLQQLLQ